MSIVNNRVDILFVSCSEKYLLKKSIKSIFNQSFKNWRLLLVDDASLDKGVESYLIKLENNHKNIFIFRNKIQLGLTQSLINLHPFIESEYVSRIDREMNGILINLSFKSITLIQLKKLV